MLVSDFSLEVIHMPKSRKKADELTDSEVFRRIFPKEVRKELQKVLSKPKSKSEKRK
jgi:hypothetical protein